MSIVTKKDKNILSNRGYVDLLKFISNEDNVTFFKKYFNTVEDSKLMIILIRSYLEIEKSFGNDEIKNLHILDYLLKNGETRRIVLNSMLENANNTIITRKTIKNL